MMIFKILFLAAIINLAVAVRIKFKDCGSQGTLEYVDIEPCPQQPCQFKRGTGVEIKIGFIPKSDVASSKSVIHGIVATIPIPFSQPNSDVCKDSGVQCPLKADQKYEYRTKLDILAIYPTINVVVNWKLQDANEKDIVCFNAPAVVVS